VIVVPTLHPAFLLRSTEGDKGEARFKETVIDDFVKALTYKRRLPQWDERVIWTIGDAIEGRFGGDPNGDPTKRFVNMFPTVGEVERFLKAIWKTTIAIDIETTGDHALDCKLLCIGIASDNGMAMCIPILSQGGEPYWDDEEGVRVCRALAWILANKQTRKVFHNGAFDTIVLAAVGMPVDGWEEDTMLAHHVVDGELPHGLDYCTSRYLEVTYYKGDVKGDVRWIDLPDVTLRSYNLRDCLTTLRLLPILKEQIRHWKVEQLYREEIEVAKIMARATVRGVEVDNTRRYWIYRVLKQQRETSLRTLQQLSGDEDFKVQGPKLITLLFETLKFPIVARTEKEQPSTDKKAITKLALFAKTKEQKAALRALIRFRKVDKLIGTYTGDFDNDGGPGARRGIYRIRHTEDDRSYEAVHATWKLLVVTGRLASSPNMQNLPPLIKKMFRARVRHQLVAVDLSQAELRGIAYYANDEVLLEAYRRGLNVHTVNATMLLGVRNPGPDCEDTNPATEEYLEQELPALVGIVYDALERANPKQWKDIRRFAKEVVFADNYDASAETIYEVMRAKRDRDTDELIFKDITLGKIEAAKLAWEGLHPAIKEYWRWCVEECANQGYLRCQLSDRIRWFRAGQKKNEVVNFLIQALVAAHMNKATIRIAKRLREETNDEAQIVIQVHDQLVVESPDWCIDHVKRILKEELSVSCKLVSRDARVFPDAMLPPDKCKAGAYLNEV
jgi:DNA polymerase I-like protein with 3'-5' exonuclease and polymerase domains